MRSPMAATTVRIVTRVRTDSEQISMPVILGRFGYQYPRPPLLLRRMGWFAQPKPSDLTQIETGSIDSDSHNPALLRLHYEL